MLFYVLFVAFFVAVLAQSDPSIVTPASLVQCQPALISWTASNSPVFLSLIPGGQPGAAPLKDFGKQSGTSMTWVVDIPAGTSITCQLRDALGVVAYSAPVTIQSGYESSCVNKRSFEVAGVKLSRAGGQL
ncbi:hypothetical protein OPQ81_001912 [Rhizoctonia solani]|nr:hypothetical protein OPQ81_001912 [Rhizoctonia solani]